MLGWDRGQGFRGTSGDSGDGDERLGGQQGTGDTARDKRQTTAETTENSVGQGSRASPSCTNINEYERHATTTRSNARGPAETMPRHATQTCRQGAPFARTGRLLSERHPTSFEHQFRAKSISGAKRPVLWARSEPLSVKMHQPRSQESHKGRLSCGDAVHDSDTGMPKNYLFVQGLHVQPARVLASQRHTHTHAGTQPHTHTPRAPRMLQAKQAATSTMGKYPGAAHRIKRVPNDMARVRRHRDR